MKKQFRLKDGTLKDHESVLLRQTWKDHGKVRHHTVASLTHADPAEVDALEQVLNKGARLGGAVEEVTVGPGLRHGDLAAIWEQATKLGLPKLLGPDCPERTMALALIAGRLARPSSKLACVTWLQDTTLGRDLGLQGATTDDAYRAMDWLIGRQDSIEAKLAARYLADPQANLGRMALFDLTSTRLEGHKCELGEFGHSRDKKKGRRQVEFALITNPAGCPVALRVFPGNTSDPKACVEAVEALAGRFHIDDAILVGDRGSVTGTRIADLKEHGLGWIGALKHQQIAQLADDQDVFQPSLFDRQGILEIESERYPGERLIVCHNPDRAAWQQAKRERLVEATLALLGTVADRVDKGRLKTEASIGRATGRVIGKHGVARLITVETGPGWIAVGRNQTAITAEAALDGFYVIRTSVPASRLDPADTVRAYKNLSHVEQDFASIKGSDIEVRPIWHRRADRVQAHLLICLLAALIAWHLRQAWAPLTYGDEQPKDPGRHPVNPQTRSRPAARKASTQTTASGGPARSFRDLIDHLALMQRVTVAVTAGTRPAHYTRITQPTDTQAEAFRLIGAAIPERLTPPR